MVKIWPLDLWPWKSIGFQTLLRTMYVPSLVKIHWRMLILECSQGCYAVKIWPGDIDLWPWKSIGFQTLLRTKYVPSLVKIHWRMLIPQALLWFSHIYCQFFHIRTHVWWKWRNTALTSTIGSEKFQSSKLYFWNFSDPIFEVNAVVRHFHPWVLIRKIWQ